MSDDAVTNFYKKKDVKKYSRTYINPHFDKHQIKVPFRMIVIGASGAGKTLNALEVLKRMKDTFDMVVLVCKCADEPLYQYLRDKLKAQVIIFEINARDVKIPGPVEISKMCGGKDQVLVIYDDLVTEKDLKPVEEMFIRGRKLCGGISMMFLSQSFYKIPKIIRVNSNYVILKKLANNRDLKAVLSEFELGMDEKALFRKYESATKEQLDFLMIRVDARPDDPYKFTHNFLSPL